MTYSIGEVSEILNISISTLRYYDKEGLLPLVNRTSGNMRVFDETDIECLKMIECLKTTGMQLKEITLLQNALNRINYKCEYYRIAKEKGTTNDPGLQEELAMKFLSKENNPI